MLFSKFERVSLKFEDFTGFKIIPLQTTLN